MPTESIVAVELSRPANRVDLFSASTVQPDYQPIPKTTRYPPFPLSIFMDISLFGPQPEAEFDIVVERLASLIVSHSAISPASPTSLFLSSILHSILSFHFSRSSARTHHTAPANHLGRYLYAQSLLASGSLYSALDLAQLAADQGEVKLAEIGARACEKMGRYREGVWLLGEARAALLEKESLGEHSTR